MHIQSISLQNFRCFTDYTLPLSESFTLLIGDNGSGKTALLDALAVAAGAFLLGIPNTPSRSIEKEDIRLQELVVGQVVTQEQSGETVVEATGIVGNMELTWMRSLTGAENRTTRQHARGIQFAAEIMVDRVRSGETLTLPVIGYYGTGRLWRVLREKYDTSGKASRFSGYNDCLNPASDHKSLFRWFKTQELAALQSQQPRYVLEAVRQAIQTMIPDTQKVWWDVSWDELRLEINKPDFKGTVPFHLLSDGYRNMVGMVGDIAYRMAQLNPHLNEQAALETPGIVLIDEIDLHLHPNWQRQVVGALLKTFPQVQFVATSHSPFIIQSLYEQPQALLWSLETRSPMALETKSIEDIAETKQGVELPQQSQRFLDMMEVAKQYYALLEQGAHAESSEVAKLREQLDLLSAPFSNDPAFYGFLEMQRLSAGLDGTTSL